MIPNDHEPLKGYAVTAGKEPRRNDDWDTWCDLGFAIFRAVGDDAGRHSFKAWSRKSPKHSDAGTEGSGTRSEITRREITAASIFYRANLENPRWPVLIGNSIEAAIEIDDLSLLPATQYDQQRKDAAKRSRLRVGTLDDLVELLRSGSDGDRATSRARRSRSSRPSRGRTRSTARRWSRT